MDIKHLVEHSLFFLVDNSHFVIQVTIFVIVVLVVIYLFNLIVSGGDTQEGLSKKDITELETRIKTVLEQANHVTQTSASVVDEGDALASGSEVGGDDSQQAAAASASKEVLEQIENLKKEVEQKEVELQELKESASMGGGLSEEESKKYMDKINELEAKLQEYEIIEDEIADLSHFKEENERLKKQLEELQSGGGSAAPTSEESLEPEAVPEEALTENNEGSDDSNSAENESSTEESVSTDEALSQAESMLKGDADEEKPEEEYITKDVIDDFNQAVKEDVYGIKDEQAQDSTEDSSVEDDGLITDDLLAEFSKQLEPEMNAQVEETEKQAQSAAENKPESLIDTEKMMQEMEELKELPEDEASISALEEDTDIEKMANEATKLSSDT